MIRALLAGLCALSLSACIDSKDPILSDSQPILGQRLNLQLYSLRNGHAYDPERSNFIWNGKLYVHASGSLKDVRAFSVHPLEGSDYIVQSRPAQHPEHIEYALMRKLAKGLWACVRNGQPFDSTKLFDTLRLQPA